MAPYPIGQCPFQKLFFRRSPSLLTLSRWHRWRQRKVWKWKRNSRCRMISPSSEKSSTLLSSSTWTWTLVSSAVSLSRQGSSLLSLSFLPSSSSLLLLPHGFPSILSKGHQINKSMMLMFFQSKRRQPNKRGKDLILVFVSANCMTFNPLLNFPRPHKVGDWIKDLDGRATREPHSTRSLRSHKILHRIPSPRTPLTNSDLSNLGVWSVQDIGKNGSNLNKGDSGDFCDLFTTDAP